MAGYQYGQHEAAKTPVFDANSGKMTLLDVERQHVEKALRYFNFQINKTSQFLGIDRKTLRAKIRNYNIDKLDEWRTLVD